MAHPIYTRNISSTPDIIITAVIEEKLQMEDIMDTKKYDKTMHNMIQLIAKDKMDTYPVLCGSSGHVLIK
jgi:hypothetical protein